MGLEKLCRQTAGASFGSRSRWTVCWAAAIAILVLAASSAAAQGQPKTLVVAEVVNVSDYTKGDVADLARNGLITALMDLESMNVVPREQVDEQIHALSLPSPLGEADLKKLGAALSADLVVAGRVTSCQYNADYGNTTVRLLLTMYDPAAGAVVRRALVRGTVPANRQKSEDDQVKAALKEAAYIAVDEISQTVGITGHILTASTRDRVLVSMGTPSGVRVGSELAVYRGRDEVARLIVTEVHETSSICRLKTDTPLEDLVGGMRVLVISIPSETLTTEDVSPPEKHHRGGLATVAAILLGVFILSRYIQQQTTVGPRVSAGSFRNIANNSIVQSAADIELQVRFADSNGVPVPDGTSVEFRLTQVSLTRQTPFLGTIDSPVTTTGGLATTTWHTGDAGLSVMITARVGSVETSVVVRIGSGPVASVSLTAQDTELLANGATATQITAEVFDAAGNHVIDGTTVEFTTTGGTLSRSSVGTVNGLAQVILTSSPESGPATITATVGSVSASVAVNFVAGQAASIALSATTTSVAAGPPDQAGTSLITAVANDAFNNPVADGTQLNVTVQPATAGSILETQPLTTVAGRVIFTFRAGTTPGVATIQVSSGTAVAQINITVAGTTAGGVTLLFDPASVPADGVSFFTVTAQIVDAAGQPIADGTAVQFSVTAGATIRNRDLVTHNGRATAQVSSTTVGLATLTVTVPAGNQTASVNLSFTALPPSAIRLSAAQSIIDIGIDGSASTTITGVVTNVNGVLVQDGTPITFTTNLGTVSPGQPTTVGGTVTVTFTSITTGVATVTATSGDVQASIQVTVNPGPAAAIVLTADPAAIRADGNSFSTITATIVDRSGNRVVDGTKVDFTATLRTIVGLGTTEPTTITPSGRTINGQTTAILVSRNPDTNLPNSPGSATVVATVSAVQPPTIPAPLPGATNGIAEVLYVSQTVADIRVGVNPTNVRGLDLVGNAVAVTAEVVDINNNPVVDGTAVFFSSSHGLITGTAGTVNGVARSLTTGGIASATLLTGGQGMDGPGGFDGLVDIFVSAGGLQLGEGVSKDFPGIVIFSGPPDLLFSSLLLDNQAAGVPQVASVRGALIVTVRCFDENNNPVVEGTRVRLRTSAGDIDQENMTTEGGVVTTTLRTSTDPTAPTELGVQTITATIDTGLATGPLVLERQFQVVP